MRKQEINIYQFNELSKAIQEKVLNRFRENNDYPFLEECLNDLLEEQLKENEIKPIEIPFINYSLSNSQGDGVCFTGLFKWKTYTVNIKHDSRYCHSKTADIKIWNKKGDLIDDNKGFNAFKNIYYNICKTIENHGYEIIEAEDSEVTIKENIEANEYEFYADGDIY